MSLFWYVVWISLGTMLAAQLILRSLRWLILAILESRAEAKRAATIRQLQQDPQAVADRLGIELTPELKAEWLRKFGNTVPHTDTSEGYTP